MDHALIVWEDKYLVHCELIDEQHKGLVDMTNELLRGCKAENGKADVIFIKTVRKAAEYAQTHFSTEEKYMLQVNYPDFEAHKKEHESFVAEVVAQIKAFEENRNDPCVFAGFLKDWLLTHIAVSDQKYAPYLKGLV
jgi:hemerythrin